MLALAILVASIGAADSLNPTTVGPALVFATGHKPLGALASFSAGVFLVSFAAGAVVILGPGQLLLDSLPHPSARAKHVAELVAGALLLLLAAVLWARRGRVSGRIAGSRSEEVDTSAFLLGAGIMAVELPTASRTSRRLRASSRLTPRLEPESRWSPCSTSPSSRRCSRS